MYICQPQTAIARAARTAPSTHLLLASKTRMMNKKILQNTQFAKTQATQLALPEP
jgi:hypothetical protein